MAKAVEKSVADTPFLDDTDDFIQSHIDSNHPPSEEVIEKEREESIELEDIDEDEKPGQHWQIEAEPPEILHIKDEIKMKKIH